MSAMKRLLLSLSLLLCCAASAALAAETVSAKEFESHKELVQTKLDAQKEAHGKDLENVTKRVEEAHKRIEDYAGRLNTNVTWWVAGLTLALTALGYVALVTVRGKVKEEAQTAAEDWFKLKTEKLTQQIQALEAKAQQAHSVMDKATKEVQAHKDEAIEEMQQALNQSSSNPSEAVPLNAVAAQAVQAKDAELQTKPESTYTFEDWNTRAFAAYEAKKFEDAAYFWLKAAEAKDSSAEQIAKSLRNRGVAQGKLSQHEVTLDTYDEVIRRFSEASEPAIREQVAMAMVNKGHRLGLLGQYEAELATYDELTRRFGEASEPAIHGQLAKAMINKGIALAGLGKREAAIATYDVVIRRFSDATDDESKRLVTKAKELRAKLA